ncbi:uncharacterized protein [Argopecten irradians]|uniref:uncharacterized protein n=1 Tax=Argopecten irradians TaxID=31199 RepID=UPI003713BD6C
MALVLKVCTSSLFLASLLGLIQSVKVMSFNVGMITYINHYRIRKQNIIKTLTAADYDVMCLQEMPFGRDIALLKSKLDDSVTLHTAPLYQETMFFGSVNAPPCHNAPLTTACVFVNCLSYVGDLAALAECAAGCGLLTESQGCITCLLASGWSANRCFNYLRAEEINIPGVVLLSKRKVNSVKVVDYEPNVKQFSKRAYIEAEIEGVGTVFCSHSTSNSNTLYYEPNLKDVYASLAEQNLADSRKLTTAANLVDRPVIAGDLNMGPSIPGQDVGAEFPDSYNHFLSEGFTSPYVDLARNCTFCASNPLTGDWETNEVLDHVMIRDHTVISSKRVYDRNIPGRRYTMSDHYGVEVEVTDKPTCVAC